jgi:hypothetical protein
MVWYGMVRYAIYESKNDRLTRYNNLSVRLLMRSLHFKHNKKVRMSANEKVADIAKRMLI